MVAGEERAVDPGLGEGGSVTQDQLQGRVAYLQDMFNLNHWEITVTLVDYFADSDDAAACVIRSNDYDLAEIQVARKTLDTHSKRELDVALAHELIHIHFRDLDNVTEAMTERLPEAQRDAYTSWLAHEQEGIVDRLARAVIGHG